MNNYNLFQKRITTSNIIPLDKLKAQKVASFKSALTKGYNRETVTNENNVTFNCLISDITTHPEIEKKTFSTLLSNNCAVGDILIWNRLNSHWIITDVSETEKAIFQGYISQALYQIKWRDLETDKIYSTWACTKGRAEETISSGVYSNISYDKDNEGLYLMIPAKAQGVNLLKRYAEIFVNGKKWEIQSSNRATYKNLIELNLRESAVNEELDNVSTQVVDGKIPITYTFSCSLDSIQNIKVNQTHSLSFALYNNKEISNLVPTITVENCVHSNGKITFSTIGNAIITIKYATINKTYSYIVSVAEEAIINNVKKIVGDTKLNTMTYVSYAFVHILNGENIEDNGTWIVDDKYFKVLAQTNKNVNLKIKNKIGNTVIKYRLANGEEVSLNVNIKSIYEGG